MDDLRTASALSLIPKCSDVMRCNYGAPVPGESEQIVAWQELLPCRQWMPAANLQRWPLLVAELLAAVVHLAWQSRGILVCNLSDEEA